MSCDTGDGVDHYVYADPEEDKLNNSESNEIASTETGTANEVGTSYDPPASS